jgi:hypothetical protein
MQFKYEQPDSIGLQRPGWLGRTRRPEDCRMSFTRYGVNGGAGANRSRDHGFDYDYDYDNDRAVRC